MPTRPLGAGTVNLAVNMPQELRADVGRLAAMADESAGAWIRELILERVRAARRDGKLSQPGQLAMRLGAWVLFALGGSITGYEAILGHSELRRRVSMKEPVRIVRLVRSEGEWV